MQPQLEVVLNRVQSYRSQAPSRPFRVPSVWRAHLSQNTSLALPKPSHNGARKLAQGGRSGAVAAPGQLAPSVPVPSLPLGCEALQAAQVGTSQLQCSGPGAPFPAVAAGAEWACGTHSLPCLLAGSEDGLTICGCFAGCHCALTCFHGRDFIGSGHRVSAHISATVRADSVVSSAAAVGPCCIS